MRICSNPGRFRLTAMVGDRSLQYDIPGDVWRAIIACQAMAGEDVFDNLVFDTNRPGAAKFLAAVEKGLKVPPVTPKFAKAGSKPAPRPQDVLGTPEGQEALAKLREVVGLERGLKVQHFPIW